MSRYSAFLASVVLFGAFYRSGFGVVSRAAGEVGEQGSNWV